MKIISHTDNFADAAKGIGKLDDAMDAVKYGDDIIKGASGAITIIGENELMLSFQETVSQISITFIPGISFK